MRAMAKGSWSLPCWLSWSVPLVMALAVSTGARAQLDRATGPVATPGSSTVLQDDALALDVNPAAIGLLPSWSFALLHADVDRQGSWLGRGDALYFASPVIGPLALGLTHSNGFKPACCLFHH